MTVKTFITLDLNKHDMQRRTGNHMLTDMVIYTMNKCTNSVNVEELHNLSNS